MQKNYFKYKIHLILHSATASQKFINQLLGVLSSLHMSAICVFCSSGFGSLIYILQTKSKPLKI